MSALRPMVRSRRIGGYLTGRRQRGELVPGRSAFCRFPGIHVGIGAPDDLAWRVRPAQHGDTGGSTH
jgi:hypothetical protein